MDLAQPKRGRVRPLTRLHVSCWLPFLWSQHFHSQLHRPRSKRYNRTSTFNDTLSIMNPDYDSEATESDDDVKLSPTSTVKHRTPESGDDVVSSRPHQIAGENHHQLPSPDSILKGKEEVIEAVEARPRVFQEWSKQPRRYREKPKTSFIWQHGKRQLIEGWPYWVCLKCASNPTQRGCVLTCRRSSPGSIQKAQWSLELR
jgi:hypothetical protein